jgi:uncharacterized protein (DUF433 family)/DNA-binding transcriptional MerR regulator
MTTVRSNRLPIVFPVPLASTLSGATPRQLSYWRRPTAAAPALLEPAAKRGGRFLYSWADVVALRAIVYLRQEKSLPTIRTAVSTLRRLESEEWEHLSRYELVRTRQTIIVRTPRGELLDLEQEPGTVLEEVLFEDILEPFQTAAGERVPDMRHPRPGLVVHPRILGGYPVAIGSRVPFDVIAGLADEGAEPADIVAMYPSVNVEAIPDAQDFAEQVALVAA